MPATKTEPVRIVGTDVTVEVAPGVKYHDLPVDLAPKYGLVRMVPAGDGTYRPRLEVIATWIRATHAPRYGIHILPETLVRLGTAGFIGLSQTTPGQNNIHLESLLEHIEACRDPEYWTPARRAQYRTSLQRFRATP